MIAKCGNIHVCTPRLRMVPLLRPSVSSYNRERPTSSGSVPSTRVAVDHSLISQLSRLVCLGSLGPHLPLGSARYVYVRGRGVFVWGEGVAFARVYCGLGSSCVVSHSQLASVHIDTTSKPVIMFRIAAENDKGWVVIPFNAHLYFVT